ncbi:MAG: hypothetical protein HOV87_35420 [Catenulispora sp.]|nr:hypothetical protein [Catenulispora sp.]
MADLVAMDGSLSRLEDELCKRLGHALAEQDAASDARRESGVTEILDAYSPDQLLDAVTDVTILAAHKGARTAEEPGHRHGARRLLLALARVAPHPAAEIPIKAVTGLRESANSLPDGSIATMPTGTALWARDAYGTRFAITAPFAGADGPDRWYLWDIDVCGTDAFTVSAGYFPDADRAFAAWRAAVGPDAADGSRFEPVSDPHLAARMLPGLPDFFHPGGESEAQYAEFHRCRRLAQELRRSDFLDGSGSATTPQEPEFDKAAWIAEFVAWRSEHRPGQNAVPDDFAADEDVDEPLTEQALYQELADSWSCSEFPEFAYSCSPHRIALLAARIRDFYADDFARVVLRLVPDLAAWLTTRAGLSPTLSGRTRAYADGVPIPDVDLGHRGESLLAQIQE